MKKTLRRFPLFWLTAIMTSGLPVLAQQAEPDKAAQAPQAAGAQKAATLTFLGQPVTGSHVVICLDVSLSFRKRLEGVSRLYVHNEVSRFVDAVPETVKVNVIGFHSTVDKFRAAAEPLTAATREELKKFVMPYLEEGTNQNAQTRSSRTGRSGKDADGTVFVPVLPDDFVLTKGTSGGTRSDLALLAAWSEKPETVILLTEEFPDVKGAGEKPLGNAKVTANLREAYKAITQKGQKSRLDVFSPLLMTKDRKTMTPGQKSAPAIYKRLAEMTGGKVLTIPEGKK